MAKKKTTEKSRLRISIISWTDLFSAIFALMYFQSVLTVAHHASMWPHDGISRTVGPPAIPALVVSAVLVLYSLNKNKMSLSNWHTMVVTILVVSSVFWLSGLRTNFYF